MDRETIRSGVTYAGGMAANAVNFAKKLVEFGFDRDDVVVVQAQGLAEGYQTLEEMLAGELVESPRDSTGPDAPTAPTGEDKAKIELVN